MKAPLRITRSRYPGRTLYLWPDEAYWLVAGPGFRESLPVDNESWRAMAAKNRVYADMYRELALRDILVDPDASRNETPGIIYFCPTKFVVSATEACNLKCPYCYAESGGGDATSLGWNDFLDALRFVATYHRTASRKDWYKVSFVGGEPFLHPHLPHFLLKSREAGLLPSITTNATVRLSPELMSAIIDTGCEINISIDGASPKIHGITRRSSLPDILSFAEKLIREGVNVSATCVVHKKNLAEIEPLLSLCMDSGFSALNLNTLNRMGRGTQPTGFTPVSRLVLLRHISRICDNRPDLLRFLSGSALFSKLFSLSHAMSQCDCGLRNDCFFLAASGRMYLCGALKLEEMEVPFRRTTGIRNVKAMLARMTGPYYVEHLERCRHCDIRFFCGGECRGESLAVYGDSKAPHPSCRDIKEFIVESMFELSTGKYELN